MANPNDKVNSNMSWRHCQPAAYLSCRSSLPDQGHPPSPSRSLPWAGVVSRKLLSTGVGGGGTETGLPEHALATLHCASEVHADTSDPHLARMECQPLVGPFTQTTSSALLRPPKARPRRARRTGAGMNVQRARLVSPQPLSSG